MLTPPKFVKTLGIVSSLTPTSTTEIELPGQETPISKLTVGEKNQFKIECQISGLPKPTIKWLKGNDELRSTEKSKLENKQEIYSLFIKDCSSYEQGVYSVLAENSVGKAVSKLFIDVNNIPFFVKGLANTEAVLEETELKVELLVTFKSKPRAEPSWFFGDKQIKDGDEEGRYAVCDDLATENIDEVFVSKLIIKKTKIADSGIFKCKLKNSAGEVISSGVLSILKAPSITTPLPEFQNLLEKNEIKLECQIADGFPKSTVTWHKNGGPELKASKRVLIGKPTLDQATSSYIYTLNIPDSVINDSGVYSCKATNKILAAETKCNLGVLSAPRIIKDLKPTLECSENGRLHIEVTAAGKPVPEFKWTRFNTDTNSEDEIVAQENGMVTMQCQSESVYCIDFARIGKEMSGKYMLKLSNAAGSVETVCNVIVNVIPTIMKQLENASVTEGSECTLSVTVDGFPTPTIEWFKNDAKLKPDKRYTTKFEEKTFYLTIITVKSADQGKFKALVKNKAGQVESNDAVLDVTMGPSIIKPLKDLETVVGKPFELTCEVSGTPKPTAQWFKGDHSISPDDQRIKISSVENTHSLKIEKANEETDNTLYRVQFKNDIGTSESKSNVTILIPPTFVKPLGENNTGYLLKTSELLVHILAKPAPKLKWLKDNRELPIKDRFRIETLSVDSSNNSNLKEYKLVIDNVQANDQGVYKLEASNKCATEFNSTEFVVKGEPTFVRKPTDVSVVEKKLAKIECEVVGIPQPTVEWFKDGMLIEKSDNVQIEVKNKVINILTIKSVTPANFGTYTIRAKNEIGQADCSFILNVDVAPYIITPFPEKVYVKEHDITKLECEIGGLPTPTISWIRRGEDLIETPENGIKMRQEGKKYFLDFHSANMHDSGLYTISASNKVGKLTAKTELVVQIMPRFIRKISDTQVIEKRVTKLEAEILAVPKPDVVWFKDGEEIKSDDRVQAHDAKGGVYQLSIKNSRKDDTGVYTCRAINEIGQTECVAQLVIEMAPQFLKKLEKLDAVESCDAEWIFQLIGIPKPDIEFTLNNNELDLDANKDFYTFEEQDDHYYCLRFKSVRRKDVGNWTCTATNTAGKASCIAKLETLPLTPPNFILKLAPEIRLPQEQANKLDVKVSGIPFPQIEWFKDGRKIDIRGESGKYKLECDMVTGTLSLVIFDCQIGHDSGLYKARIFNQGGECSCEGNVTVKGRPPKFIEKPEKIYVMANETATFAAVVEGDPQPIVTWTKGRNLFTTDISTDLKIYYDESVDVNFMEIANCKSKDAGTYQVTATNEFGSEIAPVTLIITQNPEEVVDLKSKLKNRDLKKRSSTEEGPDWGKLRKASQGQRPDDVGPDGIKLKHVELVKKQAEDVVQPIPEEIERSPFVPKTFDPRDPLVLEKYEPTQREKSEEDVDTDPKLKPKLVKQAVDVPNTVIFILI